MTDLNFQRVSSQIVATLTRILGAQHLALAEEAAQDALVKALQLWPHEGIPDNPTAWHLIAESMRLAYADRDAYLGDPDFVRAYWTQLPQPQKIAGFMLGPDGYTWGRDFVSTRASTPASDSSMSTP